MVAQVEGTTAADLAALLSLLRSTPTGLALLQGAVVLPIGDAARTETEGVPDGAVHAYRSGTITLLQVFDLSNGAWNTYAPVSAEAYTPSNVTTDRSFDADSTTTAELADVLGTLIADLQAIGVIQ